MSPDQTWKLPTIPLASCIEGHLYRLCSRNLSMGVFIGRGFIGIRQKFGARFLDTEYHDEIGAPHGTAHPVVDLGWCPVEQISEFVDGKPNTDLLNWLDRVER